MRHGFRRRLFEERGNGIGVGNGRQGDGGASYCVCPSCGKQIAHVRGVPCNQTVCPDCSTRMVGK